MRRMPHFHFHFLGVKHLILTVDFYPKLSIIIIVPRETMKRVQNGKFHERVYITLPERIKNIRLILDKLKKI